MATAIRKNRRKPLEPGIYHVEVSEWYLYESCFGMQVTMRFHLLEEGLTNRYIHAVTDFDLTGGERPSQLYSWISALVFGGEALPIGYSLTAASPLSRQAWAEIEMDDDESPLYNRIVRLSPLRGAGRGDTETA
jgi:hypothetical protein